MMIYLTGLVGFILLLTVESGAGSTHQLPPCKDISCLQFEDVCKTNDFEIRHYDPVKWVCTSFSAPTWMLGVGPAFWRLKTYLDDHEIPMTAPGTVEMPADDPPQNNPSSWLTKLMNFAKRIAKTHDYTICFLLPSEHHSNPPQPTDPEVQIVETGEKYVYVRPYNDWVKDDAAQSKLLFSSINITSYEKSHFAVGYTSPMSTKPYSEVWVEADGVPHC